MRFLSDGYQVCMIKTGFRVVHEQKHYASFHLATEFIPAWAEQRWYIPGTVTAEDFD